MQKPGSGLEINDRTWLKIKIHAAFVGSEMVDWLFANVEGFDVSLRSYFKTIEVNFECFLLRTDAMPRSMLPRF